MVSFPVLPERTALINVDMQNRFADGSPFSAPDGLAVQERINRVAAACRAAGIVVIHSSHVLRSDGSNEARPSPALSSSPSTHPLLDSGGGRGLGFEWSEGDKRCMRLA